MTVAATARALRTVFRSPALLISPLAQSLFFLLIYSGQFSNVGAGYLDGQAFIAFLLPLILLTGVATGAGAGAAGTLTSNDLTSGYLDRLRMAHGTATPSLEELEKTLAGATPDDTGMVRLDEDEHLVVPPLSAEDVPAEAKALKDELPRCCRSHRSPRC